MKYRLGLDLGTASIGAVAVEIKDDQPTKIVWHAVRIFSEPTDRGVKGLKLKKAQRREARHARRQTERRARRLKRVAGLAALLKLDKSKILPDSGKTLIELRARSATKQIKLEDFFRVMMHLAKQRGYPGKFRSNSQKTKENNKLAEEMEKLANSKQVSSVTLGEYLYFRYQNKLPVRLGSIRPNLETLSIQRDMVKKEFEQIWSTQTEYYPMLSDESIKRKFFEAIFYQRPLKSVTSMIGNCLFEPNLPRAPKAHMAFQRFRIEKTLRDLRWGGGKFSDPLTEDQIAVLRKKLNNPHTADGRVSFKDLNEALEDKKLSDQKNRTLNLKAHRDGLLGNKTVAVWKKLNLLEPWKNLSENQQTSVINLLADLGSPEILEEDRWHLRFQKLKSSAHRQFEKVVVDFINKLVCHKDYDRFSSMGFESGRASYSIKTLNKINDWFENPWWPDPSFQINEDSALRACYPQYFKERTEWLRKLEMPKNTGNDVVNGALRELRCIVNRCVDALGDRPQDIVIEMAREVSVGVTKRNEWEEKSRKNEADRKRIAENIIKHGEKPTNTNILRYQLWKAQELKCCPYCDESINFEKALSGKETEIEHILPRSWTQVGRKQSEIVLSHRACNAEKANKTPYEAFKDDIGRWEAVKRMASLFEEKAKTLKKKDPAKSYMFKRKAELLLMKDEILNDESIDGFVDRQLQQTSWIAKVAAVWLKDITQSVWVSRGQFTARLRTQWALDTVIPEVRFQEGLDVLGVDGKEILADDFKRFKKCWEGHPIDKTKPIEAKLDKRLDHRHHAIDALVIALTTPSLYKNLGEFAKAEYEEKHKKRDKQREITTGYRNKPSMKPPLPEIRDKAIEMIKQCELSHKPDRNLGGAFFEDTAYGVSDAENIEEAKLTIKKTLKDLVSSKSITSTEKARNNLMNSIISPTVKKLVIEAFDRNIKNGKTFKEALSEPIDYPAYKTKIWKVKCHVDRYAKEAVPINHASRQGNHTKYLLADGYAYLECRMDDKKKAVTELVSHQKSQQIKSSEISQGTIRFFKKDTVLNTKDNKSYLVRKFSAINGGTLFLYPVTETRTVDDLEKAKKCIRVSGRNISQLQII